MNVAVRVFTLQKEKIGLYVILSEQTFYLKRWYRMIWLKVIYKPDPYFFIKISIYLQKYHIIAKYLSDRRQSVCLKRSGCCSQRVCLLIGCICQIINETKD